ncbi:hypothetical protein HYFRA_00006717 [Hymenoscyphus fraxineus]|uniref:Uncharacterized protein n=1 Tax=Hymenoscyphus fraxineus TaxID=746836 RepID=A0A9N9PS55_9HELO|nr:hypothetical protein HYFRA_00006717 [Hymenoscyphus fraxineus]
MDRIHGIVQIYGISCNPNPPGDDDVSKLHNLEDEFGMELVAKAPLMSQLFIHSTLPEPPRRSWLISQKCKVGDGFWACFTPEYKVEVLGSMKVSRDEGILNDFSLRFEGKVWNLDDFTRAHLFAPFSPLFPETYRGLMLDNHISEMVLKDVVDYFETESSMNQAIHDLYHYYCHDDPVEPSKIIVALLGSSCRASLPVVDYVALVLAADNSSITDKRSIGEAFIKGGTSMIWKRIGLMRWREIYTNDNQELHGGLPTPQHVKCNIH